MRFKNLQKRMQLVDVSHIFNWQAIWEASNKDEDGQPHSFIFLLFFWNSSTVKFMKGFNNILKCTNREWKMRFYNKNLILPNVKWTKMNVLKQHFFVFYTF